MAAYGEAGAFSTQKQSYGGVGLMPDDLLPASGQAQFFQKAQRQRVNIVPVFQCLLLPWLFFCFIYGIMSFNVHYTKPKLCFAVVALAGLVVFICSIYAVRAAYRKWNDAREGAPARPPSWFIFLFISTLAAWLFGIVFGNMNFAANFQPYYDYTNLNVHWGVDPSTTSGQELMDAGRLSFVNRSTLDLRRSMGFRNLDTYCVAPITVKSQAGTLEPLATYDFWAVGLNCCEGNAADFHCGEFNNPKARQGLRLLKDDQRAFFRLAVQQASATYGITASHPLFLYWSSDAEGHMNSFRDEGYKYYLVGMLSHFAWQSVAVGVAVYGFLRAGHW